MPSVLTHAAVGLIAGKTLVNKTMPRRFWLLSILCPILPDADVVCFYLDIPYGHFLGHRGFFHSPFFALLVSLLVVGIFFRGERWFSRRWWGHLGYFFLLTASNGLMDTCTSGGLGVALLSPFSNERLLSPWQPIMASPIGLHSFFHARRWVVLINEMVWVWLPLLWLLVFVKVIRMK
jgi:inner membrane protein